MFQRFFTVARNTFFETIRQPIFGVILLTTAGLLVLNVSLAAFTLDDDNKLLLDLGLSTLLLSGLFLSAFSATGVLSREIENKTVLTVVSKPISRPVFFLGKYAGLLTALLLAFYLCFLVFVLCQRHGVMQRSSDPYDEPVLVFGCGSVVLSLIAGAFANYFYGKHFVTTALTFLTPLLTLSVVSLTVLDKHFDVIPFFSEFVGGQQILAAYLVMLTLVVTSALALTASTRLGQVLTLLVCTFFLALGIAADSAFWQSADAYRAGTGGSFLALIAYHVTPNFGPFWIIDGLYGESMETAVPFNYIGMATAYAALLTVGILNVGIALFQRREVG
jgi:ABC-2 type transport system permease protein